MNAAQRQRIEWRIMRKFISDVFAASPSYTITVHDGDEWPVKRSRSSHAIMRAAFAVDECRLYVNGIPGNAGAWAYFVFGNDGTDVVSDYTMSLESLIVGANTLADRIEQGKA